MRFLQKFLIVFSFSHICALTPAGIKVYFGDKNCIAGSINSIKREFEDASTGGHLPIASKLDSLENMVTQSNEEKSAMSLINELAQYNDISYSYELIKEEGPPHSKTFTVTLSLGGDEQYTSEGKSLKKAQQSTASIAIKNTKYEHPPVKIGENEKALTPTVVLNNVAAKLGLSVIYTVIDDILEEAEKHNEEIDIFPRKSYLQKLNETVHSNDTIRVRRDGSDPKGPFKVRVDVNGAKFIGEAHTIQNAKHEAAVKALKSLKDQENSFYCLKDGSGCKKNKETVKSPISQVYEAAQKRNLGVEFEVIDEIGPAHKKQFTTKCAVGDVEAIGQGKSKKEAKRAAAENILPQLLNIPQAKGSHQNVVSSAKKSQKQKKKNKVIKSTFDKIDRMLSNAVDYGKSLLGKITGNEDDSSNNDIKPKKSRKEKNIRSPADEIIELGNILNLEIHYADFEENEKTYSLLDLGTKPAFICYGEGISKKNARDLAARYGINVLYKLGLLDNLLDKTMTISNILDKEEPHKMFILEVIESEKESNAK